LQYDSGSAEKDNSKKIILKIVLYRFPQFDYNNTSCPGEFSRVIIAERQGAGCADSLASEENILWHRRVRSGI
jgi:hypothetical protein